MASKKFNYSSIGKTIDGTTYCSGVETLAENVIEDNENDAVVVFPSATGWASLRSSAYRMTDQNAEAHLPLPIYKVKSFKIRPAGFQALINVYQGYTSQGEDVYNLEWVDLSEFIDENGKTLDGIDISCNLITEEEWKLLSFATYFTEVLTKQTKENMFYWTSGSSLIPFLGDQYAVGNNNAPVYFRLVNYILRNNYGNFYYTKHGKKHYLSGIQPPIGVTPEVEVRDWKFRIEYVPMSSKTKIRARKNAPTQQEYIQPFNQRAEINAASALGKSMWLTAQKTGCNEITVVKNYTKLADIPPLGALVRHNGKKYRLVANHYVQTNTVYMQVTHTLSENWSEKSKHIAVDQKYRNWAIPQDILWRNLYWEDYFRVGTSLKTGADVNGSVDIQDMLQVFSKFPKDYKTVDTFAWYPSDDLGMIGEAKIVGATVPCSTYGIANSLIFSASFKDNLSAGLRASKWEDGGEHLCEEAMYCKSDGTVTAARVMLSEGSGTNYSFELAEDFDATTEEVEAAVASVVAVLDEKASEFYPSVIEGSTSNGIIKKLAFTLNAPLNPVFDKRFDIYKDPGEALKFTYQIHLIGEDDCVFGNKFAEHNPLIKQGQGSYKPLKLWYLTHYIREGTDILETKVGDFSFTIGSGDVTISGLPNENSSYGKWMSYKINYSGVKPVTNCVAWAITDENNNLYVGCNDITKTTLYFQLHHKR